MPMPKPADGESKKDFLSRCMGDEMMNSEFPDNDQRYAVCNDLCDKKGSDKKQSKPITETRQFPFEVSEVRELGENVTKITGYAAVYNQLSDDLGGFKEKIKPGFFTPAIGRDDVRALFNHDSNYVLGRTKNQTLVLSEDRKGLKIEITPPYTSYANDLINLMRRGDIDQMSFQWVNEKDEWDSTDLNNVVRTLVTVKELWDVSVVTFPAYPQTKAEVNSARLVFINYLEELLEDNSREESEQKEDRKWLERISVMRKKLVLNEKEI